MKDLNIFFDETPKFRGIDVSIHYEIVNTFKCNLNKKWIKCPDYMTKDYIQSLDEDENVIYWDYKSIEISYYDINNNLSTYIPDFYILSKKNNSTDSNNIEEFIVDIHPYDVTNIPLITQDKYIDLDIIQKYNYDSKMNIISEKISAYNSADKYAKNKGMKFMLWTSERGYLQMKQFNENRKVN